MYFRMLIIAECNSIYYYYYFYYFIISVFIYIRM
jgi:hypothetical protein